MLLDSRVRIGEARSGPETRTTKQTITMDTRLVAVIFGLLLVFDSSPIKASHFRNQKRHEIRNQL